MNYIATLKVYTAAPDALYNCFLPELEHAKKERSEFEMSKHNDFVEFTIRGHDTTAVRATFNHITRVLTVYEKTAHLGITKPTL